MPGRDDGNNCSWERRRDAEEQRRWRDDFTEWRKSVDAKLSQIRDDQIKRTERRKLFSDILSVGRGFFGFIIVSGGAAAIIWAAFSALVRSAGNG